MGSVRQPESSAVARWKPAKIANQHAQPHGGMGNLLQVPGAETHGVLHELLPWQMERLDAMEDGYNPTEVTVDTHQGEQITALIYVSKPQNLISIAVPPARYLNLLLDGAREWSLPPHHIRWLEGHPSVPLGVCRAFFTEGRCRFGHGCRQKHVPSSGPMPAPLPPLLGPEAASAAAAAARVPPEEGSRGVPQVRAPPGLGPRLQEPPPRDAEVAAPRGGRARGGRVQSGCLAGVPRRQAGEQRPEQRSEQRSDLDEGRGEAIEQAPCPAATPTHAWSPPAAPTGSQGDVEWRLVYWPGFRGRGEFVRLMFEETGTPYIDDNAPAAVKALTLPGLAALSPGGSKGGKGKGKGGKGGSGKGRAGASLSFAAPVVENLRTGFVVSQTMSIVRHLAAVLDGGRLLPASAEQRALADMIVEGIADMVEEGHTAWHPSDHSRSFEYNRGPLQDAQISIFTERRMPKWFGFFEAVMAQPGELTTAAPAPRPTPPPPAPPPADKPYLLGSQLSYADLCMFHLINGCEYQLPQAFGRLQIPRLLALRDRIARRPPIEAYQRSARCPPFTGTGPIF